MLYVPYCGYLAAGFGALFAARRSEKKSSSSARHSSSRTPRVMSHWWLRPGNCRRFNAPPAAPPSDFFNVEVNGVPMQARKGQMIIHVTDANGEYVPRFCYHDKLSVAANCRMCLVEVEKAPKPMPACATPVTDGMKVWTHSEAAKKAQNGVMEFLLINHPLDCPICDQGGECQLQDLAVGYGAGQSRYQEPKRVVLVGDPSCGSTEALLKAAHGVFEPHRVILGNLGPVEASARALPVNEEFTMAFCCTGSACQPPTRESESLRRFLSAPEPENTIPGEGS